MEMDKGHQTGRIAKIPGGCLRFVGLLIIAILALVLGTATGRYLARAAWEEGRILSRRRPIPAVIADSATRPAQRAKLALVLAARAFAADSLGLRAKASFTTYTRLDHDTLVMVLSAAYRDRLESYTWWFPIVGDVPYKGFFDFAAAQRAATTLRNDGFDAYVRPSPAFSTLGFFNDPVVSTSLGEDSVSLANTVIHEVTHNTFYPANQAVFNESFANFVGSRGAAAFFRSHGDSAHAALADARWADDTVLGGFWAQVYTSLDSAFRANPRSRPARLAARDTIFAAARVRLTVRVAPRIKTFDVAYLSHLRLDNAALLAWRIYYTDLPAFDAIYVQCGTDLPATVRQIIVAARSTPRDPFAGVRSNVTCARARYAP
jgi:predicted aminopeptidase